MASIYELKPRFQSLLRPLLQRLATRGVTANQVTLAAAALSVLAGGIIVAVRADAILLLLPIVLFVRMALNAIDGMLAREHGQKSALGALLNELGDVVSDTALYLALIPHLRTPVLLIFIVVAAAVGEMAGVTAQTIGASRRYDGPMGKSDRATWLGLLAVIVAILHPRRWLVAAALAVVLALVIATVWNRCRGALREIDHG